MSDIKLYRHPLSGHAHRVEVFLSLLGLKTELVDLDLMNGEHKQPEFLQKNFLGQVPVIEDGELTLSDSIAILIYLADKYDTTNTWYPTDTLTAIEIQRFLSIASGQVAYGPAAARLSKVFGMPIDYDLTLTRAHAILKQLDNHLAGKNWLVGQAPTIADVANYTYIAHAPEGGVSLEDYPNVQAWIARFEQLPHFVGMQKS